MLKILVSTDFFGTLLSRIFQKTVWPDLTTYGKWPKNQIFYTLRGVAQLVARVLWEHDAAGSSPVTPTKKVVSFWYDFFYPLRSNGISSPHEVRRISSALWAAYHHSLECIFLWFDEIQHYVLMIYSSESEICSFSDGWHARLRLDEIQRQAVNFLVRIW